MLPPPGTAHRRRRPALAALLLGEAMNLLDATIVQVTAPAMHADLGGSASDIQWFTTAYPLPFAVLLITGGRRRARACGQVLGRAHGGGEPDEPLRPACLSGVRKPYDT
ncbi:hypothetical protein A6A06_35295 [Streptomyces sp. CB02923]|nr:hypothetical protein A6A06_35295 [Streptomyces sp. CB02923]